MSRIYKREGSEYYYYTAEHRRRRIKKSTGMTQKRLAEKVKDQWDLMLVKGDLSFLGRTAGMLTAVKDYCSEHLDFLSKRKSENTFVTAEGVYKQFLAYLDKRGIKDLDQVTLKTIDGYIDHLDRAPKTKKNHLTVLRVMFSQAVREGVIDTNPAMYATLPIMTKKLIHRPLTNDEVELVLAHAGKWEMYYAFLLYTGLRAGDAAMLTYGNIDFEKYNIIVDIRKSGRTHELPIRSELIQYLDSGADSDAPLFPELYSKNGSRLGDKYYPARRHLQQTLAEHGKAKATLHSFRVTFNNMLRDQGLQIQDRQGLLTHSSSETTKIYTHPNPELAREYVNSLPNLLPMGPKSSRTN